MTRTSIHRGARALVAALLGASMLIGAAWAAPDGARWGPKYFPEYDVIDQNGQHYRFYDDLVFNKIVIFNFFYTRCTDICPLQNARMAQLYEMLKDRVGKDIFFYSVSMEPEVDRPEVMASLAEAFDVGPGWLFLTGDSAELGEIRYKLGERSRKLSEHDNGVMMGNDTTGEWERTSLMTDLPLLANKILNMDPVVRNTVRDTTTTRHMAGKNIDVLPDGQALFVKACAGCHSIGGGDRIGPDLHGLTTRRERDWLERFLTAPDRLLAQGDPIARQLDARFPVARMPNLTLSNLDIGDLLSFIDLKTRKFDEARNQKGAIQNPDEPEAAAPSAQ